MLDSQILAAPSAAKSVRIRGGRQTTLDGPFAETKEMIAGFNVVEADNIDEAEEWPPSFRGHAPAAWKSGRSSISTTSASKPERPPAREKR